MVETRKHLHAFPNHSCTIAAYREHMDDKPTRTNFEQLKIWDEGGEHWYRTITGPEDAGFLVGVEFHTAHIHEEVPKSMRYGTSG